MWKCKCKYCQLLRLSKLPLQMFIPDKFVSWHIATSQWQVDVCSSAKHAFSVIVKLQTSRRFVSSSTVDWHQTRVSCREQNKSRGPAGGGNKNADSIILEPQKSRSLNSAPFSILEQHRAWLFAPLIYHRRFWLKKNIGKKFSHPRLIQPISISK